MKLIGMEFSDRRIAATLAAAVGMTMLVSTLGILYKRGYLTEEPDGSQALGDLATTIALDAADNPRFTYTSGATADEGKLQAHSRCDSRDSRRETDISVIFLTA